MKMPRPILALLGAITLIPILHAEEDDFATFFQALDDSYDNNKPFGDNFYEILGTLCPESVFCPGDERARRSQTDGLVDTDPMYGLFSHQNTSNAAVQARQIVEKNAPRLNGCCESCSCSYDCHEKKNCCPILKKDETSTSLVEQTCVFANTLHYMKPKSLFYALLRPVYGFSYYMVTACFGHANSNADNTTVEKCTNPNIAFAEEITPVYSTETKRVYGSKFCAECNGDTSSLTSWGLIVRFIKPNLNLENVIRGTPVELYRSLVYSTRIARIVFKIPEQLLENEDDYLCVLSTDTIKKTADTAGNTTNFLERACKHYESKFYTFVNMYYNVFCYLHHSDKRPFRKESLGFECKSSLLKYLETSLTALFSFQGGFDDEKRDSGTCSCTEYLDHENGNCRELFCPFGMFFAGCSCESLVSKISGMDVRLYTELVSSEAHNIESTNISFNEKFWTAFEKRVNTVIGGTFGSVVTVALIRETPTLDPRYNKLTVAFIVRVNYGYDTLHVLKQIWTQLMKGISIQVLQYPLKLIAGYQYDVPVAKFSQDIETFQLTPIPSNQSNSDIIQVFTFHNFLHMSRWAEISVLSKALFCKLIKLDSSEVGDLLNKSKVAGYNKASLSQVYRTENSDMCVDDFITIFRSSASNLKLFNGFIIIYLVCFYVFFYTSDPDKHSYRTHFLT